MLLPITSLWPIIFLEGAANALRWAHCIRGCCCQQLCLGTSDFWEALLMHSNWPIALADAATNYFALASYISGRCCRCTQMGPWHWWMLLPIALLWPIIFVEGTADSLRWAHCISGCCCQWLRFSLLFSGRHCQCTQMGPLHLQCCCQLL